MPALFSDHMVLQSGREVPIWGRAEPGAEVRVGFAGQTKTATADPQGDWEVRLDPMAPSFEPRTLRVSADEVREFQDVLVGEVWLASGQSNMFWPVSRSGDGREEMAAADHPALRLFQVPMRVANEPRSDVKGRWEVCSPDTVGRFSAVAYYFGRSLQETLEVPVGLIHSSVRGTTAEVWMSGQAVESLADISPVPEFWAQLVAGERFAQFQNVTSQADVALAEAKERMKAVGQRIQELRREGVPNARDALTDEEREVQSQARRVRLIIRHQMPGGLFNAMIHPLAPFAIQGVIWYQGESHADRDGYGEILATLIEDWRGLWGQGDFPFLIVGLANYREPPEEPADSGWARVREGQIAVVEKTPNTGFANAIDLGLAHDVHPPNKQEVGRRLALLALARTYGVSVADSGPSFESMEILPEAVLIRFQNAVGGLKTSDGEPVRGFAVAGPDREWHWADARIEGETILLTCDAVPEPVAVRYAWADNPGVNLYNQDDLPAAPFRTDDWPREED